jgi:hypothetical protein
MSLPDSLTKIAALGTDKYTSGGGVLPLPDGSVTGVLAQRGDLSTEGQLLLTAAGLAMQARAGWVPAQDRRPAPEPFAGDTRPLCSRGAASFLRMMFDGQVPEALAEWLGQLAQRGQRPPEELLSALLEMGKKDKALRPLIASVVGAHGRWLAQIATTRGWRWLVYWDGLAPERAANLWEKGAKDERLDLLDTLRRTDPATARALVESSWKEERATERATLLTSLYVGLSMADEPFLEAALDDRAQEVRQRAAELLAFLPESRYVGRMIARATELCMVKKRLLGKEKITFALPTETDDLKRDGLPKDQPTNKVLKGKTLLLHQILGHVPPAYWCQHLGVDQTTLLARLEASDEVPRPSDALGWAASRAGDAAFAELLLTQRIHEFQDFVVPALLKCLPPDAAERIIEQVAKANRKTALNLQHPTYLLLSAYAQPWNDGITHAFLDSVRLYLKGDNSQFDYQLSPSLKRFAFYMPTAHAPAIIEALSVERKSSMVGYWTTMPSVVQNILDFRRDMFIVF